MELVSERSRRGIGLFLVRSDGLDTGDIGDKFVADHQNEVPGKPSRLLAP
jgi:hypothetical protein